MPIQSHPVFNPPSNLDVPIWRYMSLSRFVWIIQNRALYFTRSDLMGDPFEGYYTKTTAESEDAIVGGVLSDPEFAKIPDAEKIARENFKIILDSAKKLRKTFFLSCWHMSEEESLAMWKLYAANQDSICIRSTFRKLAHALPTECFMGTISYINYQTGSIPLDNALSYIVHKRHSFAHEREVRAVIWKPEAFDPTKPAPEGLVIPIDLNSVIEAVFISPDAELMLGGVVQDLALKYGLAATVSKSVANAGPNY